MIMLQLISQVLPGDDSKYDELREPLQKQLQIEIEPNVSSDSGKAPSPKS